MEALQAATLVPARAMKVDGDSGSIEAGKRADLDILDANPLENIHNIRSVRSVVANGVLYESGGLQTLATPPTGHRVRHRHNELPFMRNFLRLTFLFILDGALRQHLLWAIVSYC